MPTFTYPEAGATRGLLRPTGTAATTASQLPAGYRHLRYRVRLRPESFAVAAEAVLTWRMHRTAGVRVTASGPRAEPGVLVVVRLGAGPLQVQAPCTVVWASIQADRAGFAYGTMPGHPASGEEAFLVERHDDEVWFSVVAFSRPASTVMRLAGPLAAVAQRRYARRLARALTRLTR
ncbi:DUF1990 family protein [Solwaraspora sp. WMMB335]|uniref:DUF1990 family protein n=1 Tax=Solwaraspora sp. WMMB335 TaxID=3404118 RepID=UPI003B92976E